MAHLNLFQLTTLLVVLTGLVVDTQFFFNKPIRPLYFLQKNAGHRNPGPNSRIPPSQLTNRPNYRPPHRESHPDFRRTHFTSSEEKQNEEAAQNVRHTRRKVNATQLPAGFEASVMANRPPVEPRPVSQLFGDPAIMEDDEERDRTRYVRPFSTKIHIPSNKGRHDLKHGQQFSYHDYVEQMFNTAQGGVSHDHYGDGEGWGEEEYGLTNEEILHSKGYKKYKKKKKKLVKALKKKLKFKRWIQKVLEKKISYLDLVAPY